MSRILMSCICVLPLVGCFNLTNERHTTAGQELMDLDRAHSAGAVTDAEYARLRATLLTQGTVEQPQRQPIK